MIAALPIVGTMLVAWILVAVLTGFIRFTRPTPKYYRVGFNVYPVEPSIPIWIRFSDWTLTVAISSFGFCATLFGIVFFMRGKSSRFYGWLLDIPIDRGIPE